MFKNKGADGKLNRCGPEIKELRMRLKLSPRALVDKLQLQGIDLSKNAIQQMESVERFVTDIELAAFAKPFEVRADALLGKKKRLIM